MAKSKGLQISTELALPSDAVTSTMLVLGGKGMGKTNLGGTIVEELSAAGMRWAVIDPLGVWWGMRHAADGKGNGVECLILGGAHGDIPIEPTGGAVVADLVADERVNVIIDISRKADGTMWSIGERIRFMRDYGQQLYKRQGSLIDGKRREPICAVIDEVARFLPQMISHGEQDVAQCMSVWRAIVEEGRNVGIGVVLLTQRSARLNKDVAELADVLFAFRTVGPNSVKAVTDWLGAHLPASDVKAMVQQLRSLPRGSALVVSPGWLDVERVVPIRKRWTFDSSATPKAGESSLRVKGDGAKPDLKLFAERMAATIERAKADDPKALKERIRELEAAAGKKHTVSVQLDTKVVSGALEKANSAIAQLRQENKLLSVQAEQGTARGRKALAAWFAFSTAHDRLDNVLRELFANNVTELPKPATEIPSASVGPAPSRMVAPRQPVTPVDGEKKLTGNALKIASIAAAYGVHGVDKKLLATLCGATIGGSFSARISEARTAGAVETEGTTVRATEQGIAQYAGAWHVPTTTDEVLALWRPRLSGTALQIFDHLISLHGRSISRAELAEAVGATMGGSFSARLSEARSTQLLVENGSQVAVNRDLLFL